MKIIVLGSNDQISEFRTKALPQGAELFFVTEVHSLLSLPASYVIFDLAFEPSPERIEILSSFNKPVLINSVTNTLKGLGLPDNFFRINAWPGFLQRELTEVAIGYESQAEMIKTIFQLLQWPFQIVPDTPGLISARIIAMIVNEAYFALGEDISSKQEIDTAMKLGTNYPFGPFEWSEKIGLKNIYTVLQKLQMKSNRYTIAPLLEKEVHSV